MKEPSASLEQNDCKSRGLRDLNPGTYFGRNRFQSFLYRLIQLFHFRREKKFVSLIQEELAAKPTELSDFDRGFLLGEIEGMVLAGVISLTMYLMLKTEIESREGDAVSR